jgi:hypothetical protein
MEGAIEDVMEGVMGLPLELLPTAPPEPAAVVLAVQELPLERLRISNGREVRTIWGVHRGGWQALGWTVLGPVAAQPSGTEPAEPEPAGPEPVVPVLVEPVVPVPVLVEPVVPDAGSQEELDPLAAGEALLAGEEPDFAAMTKAQICSFCLATYGVALDGDQTKAQLIEQAQALLLGSGEALPEGLL